MNATIHQFPSQGDSPDLPSLTEMFIALRNNYHLLDEIEIACIYRDGKTYPVFKGSLK